MFIREIKKNETSINQLKIFKLLITADSLHRFGPFAFRKKKKKDIPDFVSNSRVPKETKWKQLSEIIFNTRIVIK